MVAVIPFDWRRPGGSPRADDDEAPHEDHPAVLAGQLVGVGRAFAPTDLGSQVLELRVPPVLVGRVRAGALMLQTGPCRGLSSPPHRRATARAPVDLPRRIAPTPRARDPSLGHPSTASSPRNEPRPEQPDPPPPRAGALASRQGRQHRGAHFGDDSPARRSTHASSSLTRHATVPRVSRMDLGKSGSSRDRRHSVLRDTPRRRATAAGRSSTGSILERVVVISCLHAKAYHEW